MARIRTLKPEFWRHEVLSELPEPTHMLAAALLNYSDDEGYFNAHPGLIKGDCFPLREPSVSIHDSLIALSNIGYIQIGSGADGKTYGRVVAFSEHQRINRKTPSKIKALEIAWETTVNAHGVLSEPSHLEQGTGNREQGKEPPKSPKGDSDGSQAKEDLTHIPDEFLRAGKPNHPRLERLPSASNEREYPPPFEEFWDAWPARSTDTKAGAYKAWRVPVNAKLVDCETLVKAAKGMAGVVPEFVPLVATWIRREGWTATGGNSANKLPGASRGADGVWRDLAGGAMTAAEVHRARELAEQVPS